MDGIEDGNKMGSRINGVTRASDPGTLLTAGRPKVVNDSIALSSEARGEYSPILEEEKRQQEWIQANRPRKASGLLSPFQATTGYQGFKVSGVTQRPLILHALAAAAGRVAISH